MQPKLFNLLIIATMMLAGCTIGGSDGIPAGGDEPADGVLINGIRWAEANVAAPGHFADSPENPGMFYKMGVNVGWSATDPLVSSKGDNVWDAAAISASGWQGSSDPCPEGWRVPTSTEIAALCNINRVTGTWTSRNGQFGRLFTDAANSGNSIFLPAAGYRNYGTGNLRDRGYGYYWSSGDIYLHVGDKAADPDISLTEGYGYAYGFNVRCVAG